MTIGNPVSFTKSALLLSGLEASSEFEQALMTPNAMTEVKTVNLFFQSLHLPYFKDILQPICNRKNPNERQ